jgi:hypothetical protein
VITVDLGIDAGSIGSGGDSAAGTTRRGFGFAMGLAGLDVIEGGDGACEGWVGLTAAFTAGAPLGAGGAGFLGAGGGGGFGFGAAGGGAWGGLRNVP